MNQNKSNTTLKVTLIILILLLLGGAYYTYTLYQDKLVNENRLENEKQEIIANLDSLRLKHNNVIAENELVNSRLLDAQTRIDELLVELKNSKASISSLSNFKRKYQNLQREMEGLINQNDSLRIVNIRLSKELDSTLVQKQRVVTANKSLQNEKEELQKVVKTAAVLTTTGLKGLGFIERSSGKLIETDKARRVDKIQVCYAIAKNTLVEKGDKLFYIQVIDPNNNVLGVNKQLNIDGKILNYSFLSKVHYNDLSLDVCEFVASKGDEKFSSGTYYVNVFNEAGESVSKTNFSFR